MKQGWTYKKLGEVCEVISGQSPEGKYYNSEGKGTPFYQGKKDFTSKYIGKPTVWTTEETKIAEKDDLLMSVRAPVGDVNFATQRLCIGRGLAAIRSKDNLNKEYLFYFLLAIKDNIKGKEGVGFASINRKEIMDIDLKYPTSLPEQQRIVSRLDSAFAHIDELKANAEKQVNEARALFQKALSKAMEPKEGWEEKKLGQLCRIERGGSPRPIKQFITDDEDGLNWIKIGDTDPQGKYIYSTKEKIRPEGLKKSRWVEKDEFLLSNSMSFGLSNGISSLTIGSNSSTLLIAQSYCSFLVIISYKTFLRVCSNIPFHHHLSPKGRSVLCFLKAIPRHRSSKVSWKYGETTYLPWSSRLFVIYRPRTL